MKEIVVISGKGGTGKSTITAALADLAGKDAVLVDADVDAANLHILLRPEIHERHEFWSGQTALLDESLCTNCGICEDKCRFEAITLKETRYVIDPVKCEGCGLCVHVCPEEALHMEDDKAGEWFISQSRFRQWFVHARLGIGEENSGKLVSEVKRQARITARKYEIPYILIDGPPGVGCPVISSFAGIHQVLIVAEASQSGFHDLKRLSELINHFDTPASCIINKADLNADMADAIDHWCRQQKIGVITRIPYHAAFYESLQALKTITEWQAADLKRTMIEIWDHLKNGTHNE